ILVGWSSSFREVLIVPHNPSVGRILHRGIGVCGLWSDEAFVEGLLQPLQESVPAGLQLNRAFDLFADKHDELATSAIEGNPADFNLVCCRDCSLRQLTEGPLVILQRT